MLKQNVCQNYVHTIVHEYTLLLPFHEVEVTNQDWHVIIRLHITVGSGLVGVLMILDPDPLVVVMVVEMGTPRHRDAHPRQPLNHPMIRGCRIVGLCLPVRCSQSLWLPVQRNQCNSFWHPCVF